MGLPPEELLGASRGPARGWREQSGFSRSPVGAVIQYEPRRSSDVKGRAQSPHPAAAGSKRPIARRPKRESRRLAAAPSPRASEDGPGDRKHRLFANRRKTPNHESRPVPPSAGPTRCRSYPFPRAPLSIAGSPCCLRQCHRPQPPLARRRRRESFAASLLRTTCLPAAQLAP